MPRSGGRKNQNGGVRVICRFADWQWHKTRHLFQLLFEIESLFINSCNNMFVVAASKVLR